MGAAFVVAGEVFDGTNGAVEAYAEALASQAATRLGPDHPLAVHLRDEWQGWFTGKYLFLDEWLADAAGRERFLGLLDASTEQLLRAGAFTEYGQRWVATVVAAVRAKIAASGSPDAEPGAAADSGA